MSEMNGGISFKIYNKEAVKRLQEEDPDILPTYKLSSSKDLSYNKKQINACIESSIIQGKSIPDIANDLSGRISSLNEKTAIKTARTAVTNAQNGGKIQSMYELRDMGVEVQKEWVATLDSRTRPSHRALDGQRKELEEAFSNGLQYPGDSSGSPSEVTWCRCTMVSYMPEYDVDEDSEYDSDEKPRMTYEDWLEFKEKDEAKISFETNELWDRFIEYNNSSVSDFTDAVYAAKATQRTKDAWRVTAMSKNEFKAEHPKASRHITEGGSTVAITRDRDIVSVCKNKIDSMKGSEILAEAVKAGGIKLDSYTGNHGFYLKCGFEPVSWCKWDDNGADEGWINQEWLAVNGLKSDITTKELNAVSNSVLKVGREDIVFYKYTGRKVYCKDKEEAEELLLKFKTSTPVSTDYDVAKTARDTSL